MARMRDYLIELKLADNVLLKMHLFDNREHRWIFSHRFVKREQDKALGNPLLVSNTKLVVNYWGGVSKDCSLQVHFVRPDKRGKTFVFGVDISEGSQKFIEFLYEKSDQIYRMKEVVVGAKKRIDVGALEEGLVPSRDLPFPLLDEVAQEYGGYKFPFLKEDGGVGFFEFPEDYRNR